MPAWFERGTVSVAKALLGKVFWVRNVPYHIVETEAYTQDDPACHAFGRSPHTSKRAEALFGAPGRAYVYLIYGMYHCLNVVTEPKGTAGAVLLRALAPCDRQGQTPKTFPTHGPGRLTKHLDITQGRHDGVDLCDPSSEVFLAQGDVLPDSAIVTTTRIGISKAKDYPWRFYIKDNPWVSKTV